ncbi:hypothetical protein C5F52_14405 [Limnohabitans sp. TS-CS-82]|nr:hypothetical protein C5F52_14405 [Limnohabitans sp. TS-CS-82]
MIACIALPLTPCRITEVVGIVKAMRANPALRLTEVVATFFDELLLGIEAGEAHIKPLPRRG